MWAGLSVLPWGRHPSFLLSCPFPCLQVRAWASSQGWFKAHPLPLPRLSKGWFQFCSVKPQQHIPFHQAVIAPKPGSPMHSDYLQTWRPHSIFQSHVTQMPPGNCAASRQDPTKGPLQPGFGSATFQLCHISHSCFYPWCLLSSAGPWLGQQHSTPRLLPWFLLLPSFIPPPQLPSSHHFSSNQRECRALSHPNPGIEVWQHPVGFNS